MLVAAMIFTRLFICLWVNPLIRLSVNPLIGLAAYRTVSPWLLLKSEGVNFIVESCANDEQVKNMLIKKLNIAFKVQESRNDRDVPCDATEVELCTEAGFIKNKNKHNSCCNCCRVRFTDKLIREI